MQPFIKFMHSTPSRLVRGFGGLWLVIYASELSPGLAFLLAAVGTAIAVTAIADICPMELMVNAMRGWSTGSEQRAA
jgi:hypothetical protein